jgi:regulatory protein
LARAVTPFQALVRLLSARERTASDLRARLARKGFPPSAIEASLERAIALGYVDDLRAARAKAGRIIARGLSRSLIELKLRAAGVQGGVLSEVMGETPDDLTLAQTALAGRFKSRTPSPERVARFLAGRGFEVELIAELVGDLGGKLAG